MLSALEQAAAPMTVIDVSLIQDLPVHVRNISANLVQIITEKARSDPDGISPIPVGRVNGLLYAINDFEAIMGLRKAKTRRAHAFITDYASMQDLVISHVRHNFQPHMIDPLRIHDVIDYVAGNQMSVDEACRVLWLDKRPELYACVRHQITGEAKRILQGLADEMSKKFHSVVIPTYYVAAIAKIDRAEQGSAAAELCNVTIPMMRGGSTLSWPSTDVIVPILRSFHRQKNVPPAEERVAETSDVRDMKKSKTKGKKPPAKTVKKAAKYIDFDPNLIYVPLNGRHPDLLLNKKTGRVALVNEKNGTYAMTDDIGKPTIALGDSLLEFLDVDDPRCLFTYKFATTEGATKALGRAKPSQRYVIHTTEKISGR